MFLTKGDFYINNQDEFDCFLEWSWKNRCGNQERCIDYLEKFWIAYCRYFDIEYNPFDNNLSPLYTDEEFEEVLYYLRTDVE
ncbi:MAG: hypothetical protein H6Q15_662 [Bacteroidetes bacterium]|nr:hypothetical protein [Bacteroidota bacterium]